MTVLAKAAAECGCAVRQNEPLAAFTTFRIGGAAALLIEVTDAESLPALLAVCKDRAIPWMVLGCGSNLLVDDNGFAGAVFRLAEATPIIDGTTVTCAAGTPLKTLCRAVREASLSGLEFAYGIPGTVGGALFMNAGAYDGQMSDVVVSALVADAAGIHTVLAEEMALGYRHSAFMDARDRVILSVTMSLKAGDKAAIAARMDELICRRREKQPLEYPSAGSYFKRPPGHFAGALIEQCGLKGARVGDAQISEKHAGFLINRGHATSADVLELERHVRETVLTATGVTLEREVQWIGGNEPWNL